MKHNRARQSRANAKARKAKARAKSKAEYRTWLDRKKPQRRVKVAAPGALQLAAVIALMEGKTDDA